MKFDQCMARWDDAYINPATGENDDEDVTVSLKEVLLATGTRQLAEASRFGRIWRIGYVAAHAMETPTELWGEYLLGEVLMAV